jgi:hypothetical protein
VGYCNEWRKYFKNGEIYVFSALKEDETLDKVKDLKRVRIDDDLEEMSIEYEDFRDSLLIFDDVDVISNKKQREQVYLILNKVLEIGRHFNIFCVLTNHPPSKGIYTKRILNESKYVVWFPHASSGRQMRYLLTEYLGLDKNTILKTKKCKSRWCCMFKQYPQYMITQRWLWSLDED